MIRVYGQSDDLVEIDGDVPSDEFSPPNNGSIAIEIRASAHERAPGIRVLASYAPSDVSGACWRVGAEFIDEGIPCPWPVRIEPSRENDYSLAVVVDCPLGVLVKVIEIDRHGLVVKREDE